MKNRDENTTILQFSYRTFTIFESFFPIDNEKIRKRKAPFKRGPIFAKKRISMGLKEHPVAKPIIGCIAVALSLFHLYAGAFGVFETMMQRSVHILTLLALAFLVLPASKRLSPKVVYPLDIALAGLALVIELIVGAASMQDILPAGILHDAAHEAVLIRGGRR